MVRHNLPRITSVATLLLIVLAFSAAVSDQTQKVEGLIKRAQWRRDGPADSDSPSLVVVLTARLGVLLSF